MNEIEWNPRWVRFCRVVGLDLETRAQGVNAMYMNWINRRWDQWDQIVHHQPNDPHTPEDVAAFDKWLAEDWNEAASALLETAWLGPMPDCAHGFPTRDGKCYHPGDFGNTEGLIDDPATNKLGLI